jgi:diacylglycerol kinase family enzyme
VGGFLIVNPRSGEDSGTRHLVEAAARRGVEVHVLRAGEDLAEVVARAPGGPIGMAGGDGSLATVATVCVERGVPFVCVPFGTRNHFARDLGLDRDHPTAALAAFDGGRERRIDLAWANDRLFLNNVSLGVYARLVHRRERHRRRRDALARMRAFAAVVQHPHRIGLRVDAEPVDARVLLVANNSYRLELLSLGERERLDDGHLHLYAPTGLLRSGWTEREAERFVVDATAHELSAAVDGEPETLRTPIEFRIAPRTLRVLVPAAGPQRVRSRLGATEEEAMENPEPTEREQELSQTERQQDEEEMRYPQSRDDTLNPRPDDEP